MTNEEKNEQVETQENIDNVVENNEDVENTEDNESNEDNEQTEDTDSLRKKIATLEAQKEHWREKARNPSEKEKKESENQDVDKYTSLLLRTEGFKTKEEQDIFINASKKTGEDIDTLIQDDYLLSKVEKLREKKKTENATPSSDKRNDNGEKDNAERLVRKFKENGKMPKTAEDREKIRKYIRQNGGL